MLFGFLNALVLLLDKAAGLEPAALGALFMIALLTELGLPFPFVLDTTVLLVGYRAGFFSREVGVLFAVLYLGGVAGSGLVYLVARLLGNASAGFLRRKFPALAGHAERFTAKLTGGNVVVAVAVGRLTPGLLIPVSVASGFSRLPFRLFVLGLALASVIIDAILVSAGLITRSVAHAQLSSLPLALVAFGVAVLISLAWAAPKLVVRLRDRTRRSVGQNRVGERS